MLSYLSNRFVDFLLDNNIIKKEEKEIYVYGYQIIIASLISILLVSVFGLVLHRFLESILFLMVFIYTRQCSGGYHAKTFLSCSVLFLSLYMLLLLFVEAFQNKIDLYQIICILSIYLLTIIKYAPLQNENKILSHQTIMANRRRSIVVSVVWILLALGLFPWFSRFSIVITLTLGMVAMLMLIEKFRKEGQA